MSGPKPLSDTLALIQAGIEARRRKRIEAAARPGETFEQTDERLRAEDAAREQEEAQAKAKAREQKKIEVLKQQFEAAVIRRNKAEVKVSTIRLELWDLGITQDETSTIELELENIAYTEAE